MDIFNKKAMYLITKQHSTCNNEKSIISRITRELNKKKKNHSKTIHTLKYK